MVIEEQIIQLKNLQTKNVVNGSEPWLCCFKKKIPESIEITHTSLFDNTVAGIKIKKKPFFSVQYHPESSPGPQDSRYLFKKFENLLRKNA